MKNVSVEQFWNVPSGYNIVVTSNVVVNRLCQLMMNEL